MITKYRLTFDESIELSELIGSYGADLMFPVDKNTGFISENPVQIDNEEKPDFPCWTCDALVNIISTLPSDNPVTINLYENACVVEGDINGKKYKYVSEKLIDACLEMIVENIECLEELIGLPEDEPEKPE